MLSDKSGSKDVLSGKFYETEQKFGKDVAVDGDDDDGDDCDGSLDDDDGNVVMCSPTQTFDTRQEVTAHYKQPHAVQCSPM